MTELEPAVVARAQKGDRAAQDAFIRRYAGPLHSLVRRSAPELDTDDATQAVLEKLLEVLPRFSPDGPAQLTTWVFTIAHRFLLDARKKRHLAVAPLDDGLEVADTGPGAEQRVLDGQLQGELERALSELPEAQRRVFVLTQLHGHALETAAETEGIPMGTLKSRLFRARAALASRLSPLLGQLGKTPARSP